MTSADGPGSQAANYARPSARESRLLALILDTGADIPQISKLTGIPMETVRLFYREHFLKQRMRVQRELVHEKLGLRHIQFILRADSDLQPLFYNSALLSGVWEELYVNTVYKIIPEEQFFLDHLAPPSFLPRLRDFYGELEKLGVLSVIETYDCARLSHPRMWAEDYNEDLPGWDFDWSPSSLKPPGNIVDPPTPQQVEFDRTDLLILQGLHFRWDRKMTEIAAKHSINRYTAAWHLRKHVDGRGLLGDYRINWLGTGRWTDSGPAPQKHQTFIGINLIAKGLSAAEMMNVRAHLHSIPYLYGEEVGDSDYNAETFIPLQSVMEAFRFFGKILGKLGDKARIFTIDQTGAVNYTINPGLFDEESMRWTYRGDLVLEGIRKSLAGGFLGPRWKVRQKGSSGLASGS